MIDKTILHYRILEKVGEGGMGEVYLAEDTELDRNVALKFLPQQYTKDPDINVRFKHEAKAAAALNHPNIITIYQVSEHEGRAFIAMEHVEGQSLKDIALKSNLSINKIIDITSQICEGLSEAHQAGIVHRDIKPDNILIDAKGRVKIADFGLAKSRARTKLTEEGSTLGTLDYMSPEQLSGEDVDHRSDIWSVGVVLYEMITGRLPFEGEYEGAAVYAIMHEEPEPLARYKNAVSEGLQRIVDKALDKEKETRYQGISDLLADLKREKRDSTSTIKPVGKVKKAVWGRRILTLACLLLIVVIVIFAIDRLQMESRPSLAVSHKQITFDGNIPISTLTVYNDLAAISPDGQFLAYPLPKDGRLSVMVQDLTGGQPVEVYRGFGTLYRLRWSPDGSKLLLGGDDKGTDFSRNLIIPRLGGKPQALRLMGFKYCWSPDGVQIAGTSMLRQSITFYNAATGDSTGIIRLHGFHWFLDLDWSPIGDQIVFATADEQLSLFTIWTVQTNGTRQQKIVEEESSWLLSPRWSHDGRAIYYLRDRGQTHDLMKIAVLLGDGATAADSKVLQSGLHAFSFTLSGDNRKLSYTNYLAYSNLWLVTGAGEEIETRKLTRGTRSFETLSLAPDGEKIAFAHGQSIFVLPIAGGETQQLTFSNSDTYTDPVRGISWSPDGKDLAFSLKGKIWLVPANGDRPARTFDNSSAGGEVAWAPHDEILYQRPGYRNFYLLNPLSGKERPLLSNDSLGWNGSPTYSPDGRNVAIHWNRKDGDGSEFDGLWIISLIDSSQRLLLKSTFFPIEWSEGGKWIYALDSDVRPYKLYKIPLGGGRPQILLTLPFDGWCQLSMTSDGKRIVCNVEETQSDVWIMENFDPDVK